MKTAEQKLHEEIMKSMATYYTRTLSESIKRGLKAKKKQNEKG